MKRVNGVLLKDAAIHEVDGRRVVWGQSFLNCVCEVLIDGKLHAVLLACDVDSLKAIFKHASHGHVQTWRAIMHAIEMTNSEVCAGRDSFIVCAFPDDSDVYTPHTRLMANADAKNAWPGNKLGHIGRMAHAERERLAQEAFA